MIKDDTRFCLFMLKLKETIQCSDVNINSRNKNVEGHFSFNWEGDIIV